MKAIEVIKTMCAETGFRLDVRKSFSRNAFVANTEYILLTHETFNSCTSTSLASVAHECGHAQQHTRAWLWVVWISRVALILSVCLLYHFTGVAITVLLGILIIGKLATLYVEFDASRRAYKFLKSTGQVNMKIVRKVLTESWLTYLNIR
jgi:Zn-dependent membrane protease YugP